MAASGMGGDIERGFSGSSRLRRRKSRKIAAMAAVLSTGSGLCGARSAVPLGLGLCAGVTILELVEIAEEDLSLSPDATSAVE